MFSGDEVGAIVVDVGSSITKSGYAGDDQPKAVFPSAIGVKYSNGKDNFIGEGVKGVGDEMDIEVSSSQQRYYVGSESLSFRRDNMEILYPCENGLIKDWDVVERLWSFAFYSRLKINPKEHPLFMVEPSFNTRQNREKLTEIAFEKYETPALFVAKDAVLSCFAAGRSTGLVVDAGGGKTSVVPIYDGYALQQAIIKTNIGGDKLDKELLRILSAKYPKMAIFPSYQVNKRDIGGGKYKVAIHDFPLTHPSYSRFMINNVVSDIRHSVCQVHDGPFDPYHTTVSSNSYEFPDGNVIEIGIERISVPELLFSSDPKLTNEVEKPVIPIQKMIYQSITLCDPEIRKEFITGIIVNGGNTLYNGFYERLSTELSPLMTPKAKVVINTPIERKYGAWIGGSIMASLGSFHQLWMSKSEYEERGKSLVERKCP